MTATEYQVWLDTLTIEQRLAVQTAVGIVMDLLLVLEGRVSVEENKLKEMNKLLKDQDIRITALEHIVGIS